MPRFNIQMITSEHDGQHGGSDPVTIHEKVRERDLAVMSFNELRALFGLYPAPRVDRANSSGA